MPDFKSMFKIPEGSRIRILEGETIFPTYFLMDDFGMQKMSYLRDWKRPPMRMVVPNYHDAYPTPVPGTKSVTINAMRPRDPEEFEVRTVPRLHKKRSNQSNSYHRRVQKKWAKRGLTEERTIELMDPVILRMPERVLHQIARCVRSPVRGVVIKGQDLELDLEQMNIWIDNTRTNLHNQS